MPEFLHAQHPSFIPPFPGSIVKQILPTSLFQKHHGKIFPLIAYEQQRPVGRIAAIVHAAHNQYYQDKVGFFGFFDSIDDPKVAQMLFEQAALILKNQGLSTMRGPYNPSVNEECGLLTIGFEEKACMGLSWNPAYYPTLFSQCNLQSVRVLKGFRLNLQELSVPERIQRLIERVKKNSKFQLRPLNFNCLEEDLKIVQAVYNHTLERNWGFVPIDLDSLLASASEMKAIADPSLLLIAEKEGQAAGVAFTLPDVYELLAYQKHTPRFLRPLHTLWLLKTKKIDTVRFIIYGVLPQFRDRGLSIWLLYEQFQRSKSKYKEAVLGWIEENNTEVLESALLFGGVLKYEWKIYELV